MIKAEVPHSAGEVMARPWVASTSSTQDREADVDTALASSEVIINVALCTGQRGPRGRSTGGRGAGRVAPSSREDFLGRQGVYETRSRVRVCVGMLSAPEMQVGTGASHGGWLRSSFPLYVSFLGRCRNKLPKAWMA